MSERTLIISDLHVPHHDRRALDVALQYALDERVDTVVINGDLIDCAMISRWPKTVSTPTLVSEIKSARRVLGYIRERLPNARIIYRLGNHEERLEHYLMRYAQEVARLGVVTIAVLLDTERYKVHVIDSRRTHLRLGKLSILHGHEIGTAASVNIAHSVLRRVMSNVVVGHWHRRQSETLKTYKGDYIGCWVVGCLCDLEPDYAPINQWQHGFAFIHTRKSGTFVVRNNIIIGGDVV